MESEPNIVWRPQPAVLNGVIRPDLFSPQQILIKCPYPLIGFGGARGGGKTDGVLGKFGLKQQQYGKRFNGIFFRREMPGADDLIDRARDLYEPMGASYNKVERQFIFRQGGRLRFRPLLDESDASKLQGQSISDAAVEESGNYPDPSPIWKLFGVLRSAQGVPTQLILTFNPGGPGHYWLRELFVKPAPLGMRTLYKTLPTGKKIPYIYIPSKVKDNPILLQSDPDYIDRLHMVGSPELVRAWLEGDFEIHEGSFFPEFGQRHLVNPFPIPNHWHKICGFDWGHNSPFCAVWGAVSSGRDDQGNELPYAKGSVVIYREYTGKGIKNVEIAKTIADLSQGEDCRMVADTQIFNDMGNTSIAQEFHQVFEKYKNQQYWEPADKNRLAGWSQFRRRLGKNGSIPSIYFFTTCRYLLDTIPAAGINLKHPEEMDPLCNDHGCVIAGTLVKTPSGFVRMDQLRAGDNIICGDGFIRPIEVAALTRKQALIVRIKFTDGLEVRCTYDHEFLTDKGWVQAKDLSASSYKCITEAWKSKSFQPRSSNSMVEATRLLEQSGILNNQINTYTEKSGSGITGGFQRVITFITSIGIEPITKLRTWRWLKRNLTMSTITSTQTEKKLARNILNWPKKLRLFGMARKKEELGTNSTIKTTNILCIGKFKEIAKYATQSFKHLKTDLANIAGELVRQKSIEKLGLSSVNALAVKSNLLFTHEAQQKHVGMPVQPSFVGIQEISFDEKPQDVYCLSESISRSFVLLNGVVSGNCDALRYLLMTVQLDSVYNPPKQPTVSKGVVRVGEYISEQRKLQNQATI